LLVKRIKQKESKYFKNLIKSHLQPKRKFILKEVWAETTSRLEAQPKDKTMKMIVLVGFNPGRKYTLPCLSIIALAR
jgi:hypothetical protein